MKSKKPKSMHLVLNIWGEGRTPCCDMEIPVMIVAEIESTPKSGIKCEKCQVIILPREDDLKSPQDAETAPICTDPVGR